MLLLRNLKTFWTVFIFLNCLFICDLFLHGSLEGLGPQHPESSQVSLHSCARHLLDLLSWKIMFFSSGNFSWITLISSLFHCELCLDIEPPGLVIRASFLSYDFSFCSTSWVISSTLYFGSFLWISCFCYRSFVLMRSFLFSQCPIFTSIQFLYRNCTVSSISL